MKNVFVLFCISFLMIFSSCSSDDAESSSDDSTVLLKKISHLTDNFIVTYTYNGNKIDTETWDYGGSNIVVVKYTYTGDLVTKEEVFDSEGVPTGGLTEYVYEGNNVTQVQTLLSNGSMNTDFFEYNSDGTVTITFSDSNESNIDSFDENGQLIESEHYVSGTYQDTFYYTYDNNNNPNKDISELYPATYYKTINNVIRVENMFGVFPFTFEYNSEGYATSAIGDGRTILYEYY